MPHSNIFSSTWATSILHFKWVLPFPVKIYPFEIFTRATPGSSLVFYKYVWIKIPNILSHRPTQTSSKLHNFDHMWSLIKILSTLKYVCCIFSLLRQTGLQTAKFVLFYWLNEVSNQQKRRCLCKMECWSLHRSLHLL